MKRGFVSVVFIVKKEALCRYFYNEKRLCVGAFYDMTGSSRWLGYSVL